MVRREVFKGCWRAPDSAREQLLLEKFSRQPDSPCPAARGLQRKRQRERSQGWGVLGWHKPAGAERRENSGPWPGPAPRWWEEDEGKVWGEGETP